MPTNMKKHMKLLGHKVVCRVTGLTGVVTSISFDLYGCVQAIVHPGKKEDGTLYESLWFDVNRLEVVSHKPVMSVPDFDFGDIAEGKKGPSDKPTFMKA